MAEREEPFSDVEVWSTLSSCKGDVVVLTSSSVLGVPSETLLKLSRVTSLPW